ncbi:MAG: hypothetical protein RL160_603 [Bacteroidota bacterium]
MKPVHRKILVNLIFLLLAVLLLWLILQKVDLGSSWQALTGARLGWVLGASFTTLLAHFLRAYRWNYLLQPLGFRMNNLRSFLAVLSAYLVNAGTSRGGELLRCAMLSRSERVPVATLLGTVITERIVDVFLLGFMFAAALLFEFKYLFGYVQEHLWQPVYGKLGGTGILLAAAAALALLSLAVYLLSRKKEQKIETDGEGLIPKLFSGLRSILQLQQPVQFILSSIGIWCCYALSAWMLMQALPATSHLWPTAGLSIVLFSAIGISIPAPAGLGIVFPIAHGIEQVYGVPAQDAANYALLNLAFNNILILITGGIAYLWFWMIMQKFNKNNDEATHPG